MALDLEDGDLVWVHDIHLMLLPLLLRQRAQEMKLGLGEGLMALGQERPRTGIRG